MEVKRSVLLDFDETHQCHQGFQTDRFEGKKCLNVPQTISEQTPPSLGEDKLKINDLKVLTGCFSSDNKENITINNSVISDESTVCAMKSFNYSNLIKFEEQLLESSNDREESCALEKVPVNNEKFLQISKKLKLLDDTISTPPSALREQISMLRKEMNEAYEFHDLEIQILKEEKKENPESYEILIEKYSTLLELYSSLKTEYEEYRREQENIRNELQSKTVDCLESLCCQIETSDNSLNSASFVSFNTDFKCSTMIDNFTEQEATLLHDVTIQTKDPLSDTDIFKTPKLTPFKSKNKSFFQYLNQEGDPHKSKHFVKLMEVETALSDKAKDLEKLEQRLFKIEDLSGLLQNEFERISIVILKENETLKENLLNKSEQLDVLTQKLFTEIISLNPGLMDRLADASGTKLLPVLIETVMDRCKNIEDKLIVKFSTEKSDLEVKVHNLQKENKDLSEQVSSQIFALQELKNSYEKQLLEMENVILTRNEEIRILKTHDLNTKHMQDELDLAKEKVIKLEALLTLSDNREKEVENKCLLLERTNESLRVELEEIKKFNGDTENENLNLKERLLQIATENGDLQEACETLKRELSLKKEIISSRDEELQNLKNREIKKMEIALAQADEVLLRVKAEVCATESEKVNFEKRCLELENTNSTLQDLIITKDIILKDLEDFKSSCESEWENIKQQIKEKEMTISDLRMELNVIKEKYSMEVRKVESLNEKINSYASQFAEKEKSYKDLERKLLDSEDKVHKLVEEIKNLESHKINIKQMQDELDLAKEKVIKLEALLTLSDNREKEVENKCLLLERTNESLRVELEEIKKFNGDTENENLNLKERLLQIATENGDLQEACETLKRELSLKKEIISSRDEELQNLKNREIKKMEIALAQADEVLLRVKAEVCATESEKVNFEKRCLELENTNSTLQDLIITKDIILKDLEDFKSSCESEWENIKQQIKEKEMTISDLRMELNVIKEKYSMEVRKVESLNEKINSYASQFAEKEKSYKDLERKLLDSEDKVHKLDEEIKIMESQEINIRQMQSDLASSKEINEKLQPALLVTESNKKMLEDRCQDSEEKCSSMGLNLNRNRSEYTASEIENENCIKLISQKNTEFESLFETLMEGLENLKLSSVGNFPKLIKKAMVHVKKLQSRASELKEENEKLDEECDSYAKVIKDLKKEAAVEWKKNNEKIQAFKQEILKLTEMKNDLEREKKELLGKISNLEEEFQRHKANIMPEGRNCACGVDLKKVNELKRTILVKEQKLLELQDMEAQSNCYKSQIEYLRNALDKERKKINEEKEKNKKLQNELNEATQNQKIEKKKFEDFQILEELRMRGSISGGVVGDIVEKEKMRKLSKDVGVLKEICRARYAEIKRLEAENASLKNFTPKNSNQMDSPIRSVGYNTRSKSQVVEKWKTETGAKENRAL